MTMQWTTRAFDTLSNILASIGVVGRDKSASTAWTFQPITVEQIEYAYRSDWITRKVVDIPAMDSTRQWRQWQAEKPEIQQLEAIERSFDLQNKVYEALRMARLYGGACLILGGGDNTQDDMTKPLDLDKVDKDWLRFIHVFGRWNVGCGPLIRDILNPWFGEPSYYSPSALVGEAIPLLQIHPSWVVRFWGAPYSDPLRAYDPWADSILQSINEALQNANIVTSAMANMVYESKFDVIKIPGLSELANTVDGAQQLASRWSSVNTGKSYVNSIVLDATEDWQRVQAKFEGMPQVLQAYMMVASGAADIPATRMLGQSPTGMNATGDSDMRNYYDRLRSDQITKIQPRLSRLDEVLIRSALGSRPPEVHHDWNPLWQLDAATKALTDYQKAQAAQIDAMIGLVPADALAIGRQNQLIADNVYPGLDQAIAEAALEAEAVTNATMNANGEGGGNGGDDRLSPPATPQEQQAEQGEERTVSKGPPEKESEPGPAVKGDAALLPFDGEADDAWSEAAREAAAEARQARAKYEQKQKKRLAKAQARLERATKWAAKYNAMHAGHMGLKAAAGSPYTAEPGGYSYGGSDAGDNNPSDDTPKPTSDDQ